MSGPVTIRRTPFASTVIAGDNTGVASVSGDAPTLAPINGETKQFMCDDLDNGTQEGAAKADNYVSNCCNKGEFNRGDVDRGNAVEPSQVDNNPPGASATSTPVDYSAYEDGFNLSSLIGSSTTLGNFIRDYPALPNCKLSNVPAQCGLTSEEIVANLAHVCTNIWEPLKAQYPNAIITNGLRTGDNIGAGPHGTGQSIDVQFSGMTPSQYFTVAQWVKNNLPYNQLILEYHTARGPLVSWLHISTFAGKGQDVTGANRILTMMNHRIKTTGLANLAG